jgi:hypothetical protein
MKGPEHYLSEDVVAGLQRSDERSRLFALLYYLHVGIDLIQGVYSDSRSSRIYIPKVMKKGM